jgi:hypothetical protein
MEQLTFIKTFGLFIIADNVDNFENLHFESFLNSLINIGVFSSEIT